MEKSPDNSENSIIDLNIMIDVFFGVVITNPTTLHKDSGESDDTAVSLLLLCDSAIS
ncbi:MAG: hypothetical protein QNJ55_20920 [Xenococcus sp. MO_188.B8]|nr:hypothetical protein [Xenococcus sp. MO_188.B8]